MGLSWIPFTVATGGGPWHLRKQKPKMGHQPATSESTQLGQKNYRGVTPTTRGKGCPPNKSKHRRGETVLSEHRQAPFSKRSNEEVLAPYPISLPFFLFQLAQWVALAGKMARVTEAHRQWICYHRGMEKSSRGKECWFSNFFLLLSGPPQA